MVNPWAKKFDDDPAAPFVIVEHQAGNQLRQAVQPFAGIKGISESVIIGQVGR